MITRIDDVLQETSLRAFAKRGEFVPRHPESLFRWLSSIAINAYREISRREGRHEVLEEQGCEALLESATQSRAERREERFDRLRDAVDSLPPDYREVILLVKIEGLKVMDVAERMGRTPNAVSRLLMRATQKLRLRSRPPTGIVPQDDAVIRGDAEMNMPKVARPKLKLAVVAAMLIALCAGMWNQSNAVDAEGERKFSLVYNVNNGGYVDVCGCKHKEVRQGSLTRRASFLRQLRATDRDILLLDAGSALFPIGDRVKDEQRHEAVRKAKLIVEAYNRMGYRAMAVGPFDLAAGYDVLKELEKNATFTMLSANLVDKESGALLFKPHTVFDIGGVKVGVVGLTLETMTKVFLGKVAPNLKATDALEAFKKSHDELKGKVDMVVALSHLREEANRKLIDAFPDVQVLVDPYIQYGNHHTWIKEHEWLSRRGETVLLRSDGQGARLGVLDIEVPHAGKPLVDVFEIADLEEAVEAGTAENPDEAKKRIASAKDGNPFYFQRISIEPHHLTDPDIDRLVDEWKRNVDPSQVAKLEENLPHKADYLTAGKCQECHQKQYDWWKDTKHANAMASLEATGDHQRFDCIGCHSLGYGTAFLDTTNVGKFGGVQCESCHGTNPKHLEDPKAHGFGRTTRKDCIVCHNKEQTLKEFRYAQARRMVACPKG